jgi:hypothetical protein
MSRDWSLIASGRNNEELILILEKQGDYEPDYIIAVKKEFEKRNLSIDDLFTANIEINRIEKANHDKANLGLESYWRYLIFVFPFFPKIFLWYLRNQGYNTKADEADFYAICGYAFYVIIAEFIVFVNVVLMIIGV